MQNQEKEKQTGVSRPIRFRAWDRKNGKMYESAGITPHGDFLYAVKNPKGGSSWHQFDDLHIEQERVYHPNDIVLMQFTGLHDKNGKEIYEGDVVTLGGVMNYEIKFIRGGFAVDFKDGHRYLGQFANPEIIGNIWENPELLQV